MAHHDVHTPYELMVVLAGTFLLALARVAVEDPAEPYSRIGIRFDLDRIGELAAVVREQYREKTGIRIPAEAFAQAVEHLGYGSGAVTLPDEGEHETGVCEMDREQALLVDALPPFDRIHLDHAYIRVLPSECDVVSICPADPAAAVLLHVLPEAFLSRPVAYFPWKIEVAAE